MSYKIVLCSLNVSRGKSSCPSQVAECLLSGRDRTGPGAGGPEAGHYDPRQVTWAGLASSSIKQGVTVSNGISPKGLLMHAGKCSAASGGFSIKGGILFSTALDTQQGVTAE